MAVLTSVTSINGITCPIQLIGSEITDAVYGYWKPTAEDATAIHRGNTKIRNHYLRAAVDNELLVRVEEHPQGVFTATAKVNGLVYTTSAQARDAAERALREDIKRELGINLESGC